MEYGGTQLHGGAMAENLREVGVSASTSARSSGKKCLGRPKGSKNKNSKTEESAAVSKAAVDAVKGCLAVNFEGARVYFTERIALCVARAWI